MRICGPIATTVSAARHLARSRKPARQPVLLTLTEAIRTAREVRFLIDGAPVPADAETYARIVLVFDGEDEDAVAAARERWSEAKAKRL